MARPQAIKPVERPKQFVRPQISTRLVEVDLLVQASAARQTFQVDGSGLAVGVADTGLNAGHVDFAGRVLAQKNFTGDNGGDPDDANDGNGHGTNVTGIIAARMGDHLGVAPGAGIIPLKVLDDSGSGSFAAVDAALQWVLDNGEAHRVSVVCMSLGDGENYTDDGQFAGEALVGKLNELKRRDVAVCIASGNDFFTHQSAPGMGFPSILRDCVSVGAVYDAFEGPFSYASGAEAFLSAPDHITPFSQRLHPDHSEICFTDIFAPGAPVRSAGIGGERAESVQHGTSQATPVVAGVVLLMQEFHLRETGRLPKVDQIVDWMRRSAERIFDGDDEAGNVQPTQKEYLRVTAVGALDAIRRDLERDLAFTGTPLRA
jgi:subtilisin family serine protease